VEGETPMTASPRTPRIFISHSHKDNDFGIQLVEDLRRAIGDESAVWYDSRGGLSGGDIWWREIKKELRQRNTFIVILSPHSLKSRWVGREIDLAWAKHVRGRMRIVPVLYQACKIPEDLQTIHTISFISKSYMDGFQELKIALRLNDNDDDASLNTKNPRTYQEQIVQDLVREVEMAYHGQDWLKVIEKVNIIARLHPEAMLPSLYRMQGWAYYFTEQPDLALDALGKSIKLVKNPQEQLSLLDTYTAHFVSEGHWNKVLIHAEEALHLQPSNPIWQMAKADALQRVKQSQNSIPALAEKQSANRGNSNDIIKDEILSNINNHQQMIDNSTEDRNTDFKMFHKQSLKERFLDIEVQKEQLKLQKERFQIERELMIFAIELSERIANVANDADKTTMAMLLRAFLTKFSSLEDERNEQE
jgi:tetratricopeptide (TPR) repeat protein